MLLAIVLIAVAASMFLVSLESLGRSSPADEFEGAFWKALSQAREQALVTRRTSWLGWSAEDRCFVVASANGSIPVAVADAEPGAKVEYSAVFSEEVAANDFILVRGALITRRPVDAVRVFPDGTCQAFAVELSLGDRPHLLVIDPWTGAPVLPAEASNSGGRS